MTTASNVLPTARSKIAALMVLFGFVAAASIGSANAAQVDSDVPSTAVKFDPEMLNTEAGARAVYHRIVKAAERVCPDPLTGSHLISTATQHCRDQAVANAVSQIHNTRLAGIYSANMKHT
jgi:UrcA family protein